MKKNCQRLFGLLLTLVLLTGLLPVPAFAVSTISDVQVQLAWPYAYNYPTYEISCWNKNAYQLMPGTDMMWWHDNTSNEDIYKGSGKTLQKGHSYTVYIWLQAKSGYQFNYVNPTHNVTAKINGQTATVGKAYDQNNYEVIELRYTFPALKEGVRYVDIAVPEFHTGESRITYSNISLDQHDIYNYSPFYVNTSKNDENFINGVRWYDRTSYTYNPSSYQQGHKYQVSVALQINPAYYGFWADKDGKFNGVATVNDSESVTVTSTPATSNTYLTLTYDYPDACTTKIQSAAASGVTGPLGATSPAYSAGVSSSYYKVSSYTSTGSEATALRGYKNGVRWKDDTTGSILNASSSFTVGHVYSVRVMLEANTNYIFDYDADASAYDLDSHTLNGSDATVITSASGIPNGDHEKYLVLEYTFPAAEAQRIYSFSVYGVTPPKAGETPTYTGLNVPNGEARYSIYTGYSKESTQIYTGVQWIQTDSGTPLPKTSTFTADKDYTARVWVQAASGYAFADDPTGTLNGQTGTVLHADSWASVSYTFHCNNEILNTADVEIDAPEGNKQPSFTAYALTGNCSVKDFTSGDYVSGVAWYDRTENAYLSASDFFVKGHYYTVYVLLTPDIGYEFAVNGGVSAVAATVNGATCDLSGLDPAKELCLSYDFPEPCGGIRISLVEANITAPRAGLPADHAPTAAAGANYAIRTGYNGYPGGVLWYDCTDGTVLSVDQPFVKGHAYEARILVTANEDYEFETAGGNPAVIATVNGDMAMADTLSGDPKEFLMLRYTFPPTEPIYIVNVSLSFETPVNGAEADFAPTCHIGAYALDTDFAEEHYSGGVTWYDATANEWLEPGDQLIGGRSYNVTAVVKPLPGYEFLLPLEQLRINGEDLVTLPSGDEQELVIHWTCDVPYVMLDPVTVTGVTAPFADESPVFAAEVPEGARFTVTGITWLDHETVTELTAEDTFEGGRQYDLVLTLSADTGCAFDGYTTEKYVNGEPAAFILDSPGEMRLFKDYVAGVNIIDSVQISVSEPLAEMHGNELVPTIPEDAGYTISSFEWTDLTENYAKVGSGSFVWNHEYHVRVFFQAKPGYAFATKYEGGEYDPADDLGAFVNGQAAQVFGVYEQDSRKTVSVTSDSFLCTALVSNAAITVDSPKAGGTPSGSYFIKGEKYFAVTALQWLDKNGTPLANDAVFQAEELYTVQVDLTAEPNSCFDAVWDEDAQNYVPSENMSGSISSNDAAVTAPAGEDARYHITLRYTFPPCGKTLLNTISVSDLPEVYAGDPAGSSRGGSTLNVMSFYSFERTEWYDPVEDRFLADEDTFINGRTYTAYMIVKAVSSRAFPVEYDALEGAYKYAGGVTAKLDDTEAEAASFPGLDARRYLAVCIPVTIEEKPQVIKSVSLTGPETITHDEAPSFVVNVPDGAEYIVYPSAEGTGFVNGVRWFDETEQEFLSAWDTFVAGHEYDLTVRLRADPSVPFLTVDGYPEVTLAYNGTPIGEIMAINGKNPETDVVARIPFTCPHSYSISLSVNSYYYFPDATEGYDAIEPLTVTVTNTGTDNTGPLNIYSYLQEPEPDWLTLSKTTIADLPVGGSDTFTIAPKTGLTPNAYGAGIWVGSAAHPDDVYCTLAVYFSVDPKPVYSITVQSSAGGSAEASADSATEGTPITVTATPETGFELSKLTWTPEGGKPTDITAAKAFTMPAANVTVTAVFQAIQYTVSFAANGGTDSMAAQKFNWGETCILPSCGFTPPNGMQFDQWEIGGKKYNPGDLITVTSDLTVTALWKDLPPATYTVTVQSGAGGSATASSNSATEGTLIYLTVTPNTGYELAKVTWTPQGGKPTDITEDLFFQMPAASVTVDVTFRLVKYTVSFLANGGTGNMEAVQVEHGTKYQLPACGFIAPGGQEFDQWSIGGMLYLPEDTITVTSDLAVTALWKDLPPATYTVTVQSGAGGSATASSNSATEGTTVYLTVTPNTGYELAKVTWTPQGGKPTDITEDLFFQMPAASVTVDVTFRLVKYTVSFLANGGTGTMEAVKVEHGTEYQLPACGFIAPGGQEFDQWEIGGKKYNPEDPITVTSDLAVTALWKDLPPAEDPAVTGSVDGSKLSYTLTNAPTGAILIAARYENGRLTDIRIVENVPASGTVTMEGSGTGYKLFLVDASYRPLCPSWSN